MIVSFLPADLPDPEVTISNLTTTTAGKYLVLICNVRVAENLISVPSVEWSGGSIGRGNDVSEGNTVHDGVTYNKALTFNPLHTSHGALYTCTATINIESIDLMKTKNKEFPLYVQSKPYFKLLLSDLQTFSVMHHSC